MRQVVYLALLGAVGGSCFAEPAGPTAPQDAWSAEMEAIANGNNRFAFDLYAKLRAAGGNLFLSPYSVHSALAMTADGAGGTTREQMVQALHLPKERDKGLVAGDLARFYVRPGRPYTLSIANALWGQKGFPWRRDFLARQKDRFGAGLEEVDFADANAACQRINDWASEKTKGKVPAIIGLQDVNALTRMVLTNAIYFKSDWQWKFAKDATADAPFFLADGRRTTAPLMHQQADFRYAAGDGFQVVEMPYKGGDLSMVVVLPAKPDALGNVEKQVTPVALAKWLTAGHVQLVRIWLPRFRVEAAFSMGDALAALGIVAAFDPAAADFSGLAAERVSLNRVIHKAFVEVNEEGTEAAAVTAIFANAPAPAPPEPVDFRADRPFLFLIRDAKHGTILFMGRLMNPKG